MAKITVCDLCGKTLSGYDNKETWTLPRRYADDGVIYPRKVNLCSEHLKKLLQWIENNTAKPDEEVNK